MEKPSDEENLQRINEVENCFGIDGQTLIKPGRFIIGQGNLIKVCRKKPKVRRFFLFNDILVYGNILIDNKKYNKQHIVPLEEIKIESLEDSKELKNAWVIKGKEKSFAVYSSIPQEKQKWMHYLNVAIKHRLKELKECGKITEIDIHAPVWIPDSKAQVCMNCNTNKFTVINRRHHCRKCGKVVCDACSNKRIELPNYSNKQERVCQKCFEILVDSSTISNQNYTVDREWIWDD